MGQILKETYGAKHGPSIPRKSSPQPLRLAAQRSKVNPEMVEFTGPDTILGKEIVDMLTSGHNTVSDTLGNVKLMVGALEYDSMVTLTLAKMCNEARQQERS